MDTVGCLYDRPNKAFIDVYVLLEIYIVFSALASLYTGGDAGSGRADDDSAADEKSPENSAGNLYSSPVRRCFVCVVRRIAPDRG